MLFSLIVLIALASIALGKLQQPAAPLDRIQQRLKAFETKHAMIKAKDWEGLARSNIQLAASQQWFQTGFCDATAQFFTYYPLDICVPTDSSTYEKYQSTSSNALSTSSYSTSDCSGSATFTFSQTYQKPNTCSTSDFTLTGTNVSALTGVYGFKYYGSSSGCAANNPYNVALDGAGCQDFGDGTSGIYSCNGDSITLKEFTSSSTCSGASITSGGSVTGVFATSCSDVTEYPGAVFYCNQPTSSSSSSSSSCFAGSETVQLKNGETKLISQVKMGDNVLAYNPSSQSFLYSEVVSIPHAPNSQHATFVHLETVEGMSVKMTPEHLLPAGICGSSSFPLLKAADVELGSCVQTLNGEQKIVSNTQEHGQGIYTIVTGEEYVVVNGIVASPFAVSHYVPNAYYNFHRLAYKTFPESMKTIAFDLLGAFAALFSVVSK